MDGNFTLFTSAGTPMTGADNYVQDVFEDVSLPASNNLGLTNNSNTNPLGQSFANNDTPQYAVKTLFVQDLVLIADRTKWVNSKPTYQVIFSENMPSIYAYVWGNIRLRNQQFGLCIDIRDIGDGFGVSGTIRNILWGFNESSAATATAQASTDQVNGSTLSFGNAANGEPAVNTWNYIKHQTALSTNDLHDYRVVANQYVTMSIGSIQIYFENANDNFEFNPGVTYVNKNQSVTTTGFGATLPILVGKLGADTLALKSVASSYSLNTLENNYIPTIGIGASGSNLIDVSTGQGASFPIGTGIVGVFGTSFYIGSVLNQSTDVLTVSPTLTFGVSGLVYKAWASGPTLAIGSTLYGIRTVIDIPIQNNFMDPNGFIEAGTGNYYYSDTHGSYRLWGLNLAQSNVEGYPGLGFFGNTNSFLQLDFKGSALDFQMVGNGIMHGTFFINGTPAFGMNQGLTGIIKQTIMTDSGPGWKSMVFVPGQSFINCEFINFEIYKNINLGQSLGILAEFETSMDKAYRYTHNATLMSLGPFQRVYADNLFLSGGWVRGLTTTQPGGVYYAGTTNSCNFNFQWFGNDFAVLGTFGAGTSQIITLDGSSIGLIAGQLFQVPGTTFHSLSFQQQANTCIISAIDFSGPNTLQVVNEQNYLPDPQLANIPQAYYQSDTPRQAPTGSLWAKDVNTGIAYLRMGNRWLQLSITATFDDPNAPNTILVRSHGGTTSGTTTAGTNDVEQFNFVSWIAGTADSNSRTGGAFGSSILGLNHYQIDGLNTSGVWAATTGIYNKSSWISGPTRANTKISGAIAALGSNLMAAFGLLTGSSRDNHLDTFNGTSWTNSAGSIVEGVWNCSAATLSGIIYIVGGETSAPSSAVFTWNGSSTGTATNWPDSAASTAASATTANNIMVTGVSSSSTDSFTFNGSSWSSAIPVTYIIMQAGPTGLSGPGACGFGGAVNSNLSVVNGGDSGATAPAINTSASFNGTSWKASPSSNQSRCAGYGGVF